MIFGEYPCCDGDLVLSIPDVNLPKIDRQTCPHCAAVVWHIYSRVIPQTFTDAVFRQHYDIDESAMTITKKIQNVN